MHKFSVLAIFLFGALFCMSQKAKQKGEPERQYKDMVITGNEIWALSADSLLQVFDSTTGKPVQQKYSLPRAVAIAKDHLGRIVVADTEKKIKFYDGSSGAWKEIGAYRKSLLGMVFDSRNELYLITAKGIVETAKDQTYYPDSVYNFFSLRTKEWFRQPVFLMDSKDLLWIGFGYGEWGGDLVLFDAKAKKFVYSWMANSVGIGPVKSIFENDGHIYLSMGLNHMFTSGAIVEFTGLRSKNIFRSETVNTNRDDPNGRGMVEGEYIGPAGMDAQTHTIYFYSQNGFFSGDATADLSKIEYWTKVIQPKLTWKYGQPDAVGAPMNVLRLRITGNNSFIFLSQYNGVGIYDGKDLKMIK